MAIVVCSFLGHKEDGTTKGKVLNRGDHSNKGSESQPIWLDNIECTGQEQTVFDCKGRIHQKHCIHDEDIVIDCTV